MQLLACAPGIARGGPNMPGVRCFGCGSSSAEAELLHSSNLSWRWLGSTEHELGSTKRELESIHQA